MNRKSEQFGHMILGPGLALAAFLGGLAYGLSPRASATVDSNELARTRSAVLVDYFPDPYESDTDLSGDWSCMGAGEEKASHPRRMVNLREN